MIILIEPNTFPSGAGVALIEESEYEAITGDTFYSCMWAISACCYAPYRYQGNVSCGKCNMKPPFPSGGATGFRFTDLSTGNLDVEAGIARWLGVNPNDVKLEVLTA